jgi:hypothetical protein
MRHNPGYGIMRELVGKRRVVVIEAGKQMRGGIVTRSAQGS